MSKTEAVKRGVKSQGDAALLTGLRPRTGMPERQAPMVTSPAS